MIDRHYYQDPYNPVKVWEVSYISHGIYLRQYVFGTQIGRGTRTTKWWLSQIGIQDMQELKRS